MEWYYIESYEKTQDYFQKYGRRFCRGQRVAPLGVGSLPVSGAFLEGEEPFGFQCLEGESLGSLAGCVLGENLRRTPCPPPP